MKIVIHEDLGAVGNLCCTRYILSDGREIQTYFGLPRCKSAVERLRYDKHALSTMGVSEEEFDEYAESIMYKRETA